MATDTLERWRAKSLTAPARERASSCSARLDAAITTAAADEPCRRAWCRGNREYPQQLDTWRASGTQALAEPEKQRASPKDVAANRRHIRVLEQELSRKEKFLSEAAAVLVLSKELEAFFRKGEDE